MRLKSIISILVLGILISGCAQDQDVFQDIGTNIASPSFISVDTANNRMYLVNSNCEVLYDWTQGSFQVLDISDPLAPLLLNTLQTESFSGEILIDGTRALMTNRFTASDSDTISKLYNINVDEGSADYLSDPTTELGENAYTMTCCYPDAPDDRVVWITNSEGILQYLNIDGDLSSVRSVSIEMNMEDGGTVDNIDGSHFVILGTQGFTERLYGGLLVVNLEKIIAADPTPVDYFINDFPRPRGIASDGSNIFLVTEGELNNEWRGYVAVIDPNEVPPRVGNTTTAKIDEDDPDLVIARIEVGDEPQEILLTEDYIFVTSKEDDVVSVIRKSDYTRLSDIPVGEEPFSLTLYSDAGGNEKYIYIGNLISNTISIIDIASLSVVATYP